MSLVPVQSGVRLHYVQVGHGPDVVLLHGLTGNLASWHLGVVPPLQAHWRLLTYDLRGHGYSDGPPTGYTTTDMAHDLHGLLDALAITQAALVGHSYGADVALEFALRHPQRVSRLVAAEPALPAIVGLHQDRQWAAWELLSQALAAQGLVVPPERRCDGAYLLRLAVQAPKVLGPTKGRTRRPAPLLRLLQTSLLQDYGVAGALDRDSLARITVPVLLVYGVDSVFRPTYELLRRTLPAVQEVLLPPSRWGHLGPLEHPALFAAAVHDFLVSGALARPLVGDALDLVPAPPRSG